MRVALYARVSTDDKGQDPENQLRDLRAWCLASSHTIAGEYVEHQSGRKTADQRTELRRLLADAHQRKFDMVLVWALDRLSREGMVACVWYLEQFATAGVIFRSYTEPHLATENELVRNILLALLSSLAKAEAEKLSARTKAGMATARARGRHIGRPALGTALRSQIAQRASAGESPYAIAKALQIDRKTALRYLQPPSLLAL